MPYRRLPNTDVARLKALKAALVSGVEIPPFKLAFSQPTLHRLRQFYPVFEQIMQQQKTSFSSQSSKSKELNVVARKAKLYISHFYQVLNFAIMRNEIPASARKFYGLRENDSKIPNLNNEKDIVFWGEKLIKGEAERISTGGNPITNPTAAVVRVRYEQFTEAVRYQKVLQKTTNYATEKISAMRSEADNLILTIWNEVEATFDLLPEENRREKSSKYGVTYVFRPYEREVETNPSESDSIEGEFIDESDVLSESKLNDKRQRLIDEDNIEIEEQKKEQLQYAISFSPNNYPE
jgi:hypothetical protein